MAPKSKSSASPKAKPGASPKAKPKAKPKATASEGDKKNLRECFQRADLNGDGFIGTAELTAVLQLLDPACWTDTQAARFLSVIDTSRDGRIDYAEFTKWLWDEKDIEKLEKVDASGFLACISICPYGVLGSQLTLDGAMVSKSEPSIGTAIVDPAGLYFIQEDSPGNAGGAAGAIYQWLGITELEAFPEPVRAAIKSPGDAKLHTYNKKTCIHVVGPNFWEEPCTREEAIAKLGQAYHAVLREFSSSDLSCLRLLPVSGGIFAGEFADELPSLTKDSLQYGFQKLDMKSRNSVLRAGAIEMCIFAESDLQNFIAAFGAA